MDLEIGEGVRGMDLEWVLYTTGVLIVALVVLKAYTVIGLYAARRRKISCPMTPREVGESLILGQNHGVRRIRAVGNLDSLGTFNGEREVCIDTKLAYSTNALGHAVLLHEVGHAHQYMEDERLFKRLPVLRTLTVVSAYTLMGAVLLTTFRQGIGLPLFFLSVALLLGSHLAMLPVELDASKRAAGIAVASGLYSEEDKRNMEKALRASAMTYALAGVLLCVVLVLAMFINTKGDGDKE
jgi:Zn-dependent membrane protease YugP